MYLPSELQAVSKRPQPSPVALCRVSCTGSHISRAMSGRSWQASLKHVGWQLFGMLVMLLCRQLFW